MNHLVDQLLKRYPALEPIGEALNAAGKLLEEAAKRGSKILTAGNGGSAADAEHITGELLKGFMKRRPLPPALQEQFRKHWGDRAGNLAGELQMGLPAVNLSGAIALLSAFANDVAPESAIAQHLWAIGTPGDVLVAISTGGNAENLRRALMAARVKGILSILLTGARHGVCEEYADCVVAVPERETFKIQELHLPIYHMFCQQVEEALFDE